jgi:type I restriction enzyme, S subunit
MSSAVPEGWRARLFGDLAKVINGYAFKGSDFVEKSETSVPIIRMSSLKAGAIDLSDAVYVAKNNVKGLEKFLLNNGDFVFGMSGSISNCAIIKEKDGICYQNQRVGRLSPINASSGFVSQLFLSESVSRQIEGLAAGGAQLNISSSQIENLNILNPPLPEQKKIASILTSVDEVIENTQKQIDKLQDLKKATMNDLLTKGIGHTEFKDSELGRIPKSWEVGSLGEISTRITDGTHQAVKTSDNGTIPFLYVSTVRDQEINWGIAGKITEDEYSKASQGRQPNLGDILYTAVGSYGYAAIVDTDSKFCFQRHIALIQLNQELVSPKFIENFLVSDTAKRQADRLVVGNAQLTLTLGELKKFNVPLPPIHEQQTINNSLNPLSECILRLGKKLTQTQSLKKSLMQDLLTGKVRVTVN